MLTASDSLFSCAFEPEEEGEWMVKASWLGDEGHEAAMSSAVSFSVEGAFPTMILVGIGLVIVIASITAVILLRRKKGPRRKRFHLRLSARW